MVKTAARAATRKSDLLQGGLLAVLVLATLGYGLSTPSAYQLELLTNIAMFVTLAYSLNALSGFTGYISFGQVAFYGFGAFATTLLMIHAGFPWYFAAIVSGLGAGLVAIPIGLVMLRLRGIYFALGMFGLVALLALIAARWDVTGGGSGLVPPAELAQGEVFVMMVVIATLAFGLNFFMARSRFGLRAMAIRDDEDVAEAMGVRTMRVKVTVFMLSAVLPGVAGGLTAFSRSFIDSPSAFDARIDLQTLLFVIAGGIGTLWGPMIGAVSLEIVGEALWTNYPEVQLAIFGAMIVLITIFLRGGLVSAFNRFGLLNRTIVKVPHDLGGVDPPPSLGASENGGGTILETKNLAVSFGGVHALRGVDVEVRRGETLCIIGANGAGKTTLFNAITGAVAPSGGDVIFDGKSIKGASQHELARRGLGRTFQIPRPFESLTVWENILLAALGGRARSDAVAQAQWVVRALDLEDIWLEPVATLPIGHRRLVELGRALARAPKVILLDEVMAGMSDSELERVRDAIRRMPEFGVGAVAGVEHVIKAIMDLADRVVVLDDGEKIADGPPDEVLRQPEVVRAYLGEELDPDAAARVKSSTSQDARVALDISGLSAGYGRLGVLEDIDLQVRENEIVSVLGANGAGKTTLLRAIAGVIAPTAGEISLYGDRIDGRRAHALTRAGIGHVPSGRELFPELTVADNLLLGATGVPRDRADERRERVFELFPVLADIPGRRAGALSGGQQQMLAIGRALMTDPKLLLLDEPSTGLAPAVVASLLEALQSLIDEGDLSILLVEQNASLGLGLAERAYVLQQGRCVLSGKAEELQGEGLVSAYLG